MEPSVNLKRKAPESDTTQSVGAAVRRVVQQRLRLQPGPSPLLLHTLLTPCRLPNRGALQRHFPGAYYKKSLNSWRGYKDQRMVIMELDPAIAYAFYDDIIQWISPYPFKKFPHSTRASLIRPERFTFFSTFSLEELFPQKDRLELIKTLLSCPDPVLLDLS